MNCLGTYGQRHKQKSQASESDDFERCGVPGGLFCGAKFPVRAAPSLVRAPRGGGTTTIILDHFSAYIIAWKVCATMKTQDVTDRET